MDISKIETTAFTFEILHPGNDEGTGFFFITEALNHASVKKVQKRQRDKLLNLTRKNKNLDSDIEIENQIETMKVALTGWKFGPKATFNGEKLEFNPKNVAMILDKDWIRDQYDEVLGEPANFFKS